MPACPIGTPIRKVIVVKTDFDYIKNVSEKESTGIADDNLGRGLDGFCRSLEGSKSVRVRGS